MSDQDSGSDLADRLVAAFEAGLEAEEVVDGVVATSSEQAAALWRIREAIPEGQKREGYSFKHDVTVPISNVASFLAAADAALQAKFPGIRSFSFGHVGDGNIHYNPLQAAGEPARVWAEYLPVVNRIVHDIVHGMGSSITAEHGIGRLRVGEVARYKPPFEMGLMARINHSLDPANIMNPGKVIPASVLDQAV